MTAELTPWLRRQVLERVFAGDLGVIEAQARACRHCSRPVRLRGRIMESRDGRPGSVLYTTDSEPEGVLLKACGSRRETVCPSCAAIYRGDARQLIGAGLRGGKGVPESVASHPAIFATLTAPSFGTVHTMARGEQRPCHPKPAGRRCCHGRPLSCDLFHGAGDSQLGDPLCAACYDYTRAVIWNALCPELWRRTTNGLRRELSKTMRHDGRGETFRLSFTKVAEFQRRGAVHLHVLLRLDGAFDDKKGIYVPPAPGDVFTLSDVFRRTVLGARVPYPSAIGGEVRWGVETEVRHLQHGDDDGLSIAAANYLAKYATKSTDSEGLLDHRLRAIGELDRRRDLRAHLRRMVTTAWNLGGEPELAQFNLRSWAHTLGYRGHWLTKSRRWSTTFAALRNERRTWRMMEARQGGDSRDRDENAVGDHTTGTWELIGRGWHNRADAWLVEKAYRRSEEARRLARDAAREVAQKAQAVTDDESSS